MSQNGMKYVHANYTWDRTSNVIVDFLERSGIKREDLIYENSY
jgi:hypothetical protein